jgi:hypothetical protein
MSETGEHVRGTDETDGRVGPTVEVAETLLRARRLAVIFVVVCGAKTWPTEIEPLLLAFASPSKGTDHEYEYARLIWRVVTAAVTLGTSKGL